MDPTTVLIMLAANLICSGGLIHLIARRMPPGLGLGYWSAGAIVLGLAYVLRLAAWPVRGELVTTLVAVLSDTAIVLATLMVLAGLRQWSRRRPQHWRWLAAAALAYAVAHFVVSMVWGAIGRFLLLNCTLALTYGLIAASSAQARRHQAEPLRPPFLVMLVLMSGMSLLTVWRAGLIVSRGVESLFQGLPAQIFFTYAALNAVLLALNLLWIVFVHLNGQLLELASRDALTRLLNRNGLDEVFGRHFAARGAPPITLLEVDVDHFKRINDQFGHASGDEVLRAVADALLRRVRGNDFVARVGGEEFLVGCVGGDQASAMALGERLRAEVAALRVSAPSGHAPMACTISVGVSSSFDSLEGRDRATREADSALYAAKSAGRDRVVVYQSPAS